MKRSTSIAQSVFFFLALFSATFTANAAVATTIVPPGGPRNVIQERSAIEVIQPTAEHLSITVVDEDGVVVASSTTESAVSTISTIGWESGEYTVQTIDDNADYQESTITVD